MTEYQNEQDYMYFSAHHKIYMRIDYILDSQSLICKVRHANIEDFTLSDHTWLD